MSQGTSGFVFTWFHDLLQQQLAIKPPKPIQKKKKHNNAVQKAVGHLFFIKSELTKMKMDKWDISGGNESWTGNCMTPTQRSEDKLSSLAPRQAVKVAFSVMLMGKSLDTFSPVGWTNSSSESFCKNPFSWTSVLLNVLKVQFIQLDLTSLQEQMLC